MASNNLSQSINNSCVFGQFSYFPSIGAQYGILPKKQSSSTLVPSVSSETTTDSLSSPVWNTASGIQLPIQPFSDFDNCNFTDDSDTTSMSSNMLRSSKKIQKQAQELNKSVTAANRRPNRRRNPWTPQEDAKLLELMQKHGQCWAIISSSLPGRTGKQVRDRYVNNLAPGLGCGNWTPEEDDLIERLRAEKGNKWSFIASHLPSRSEAQVKNRYYSFILKKKSAIQPVSNQAYFYQNVPEDNSIISPEIEMISETEMPEVDYDFGMDVADNTTQICSLSNSDVAAGVQTLNNITVDFSSLPDEERISYGNIIRLPCFPGKMENTQQFANPLSLVSHQSSDKSSSTPYSRHSESSPFVVEDDSQVDGLLEHVMDCMENVDPYNIEQFFASDLRKEETGVQHSSEMEVKPSQREMDLRKRRAYLELMLAETLKEMQNL